MPPLQPGVVAEAVNLPRFADEFAYGRLVHFSYFYKHGDRIREPSKLTGEVDYLLI